MASLTMALAILGSLLGVCNLIISLYTLVRVLTPTLPAQPTATEQRVDTGIFRSAPRDMPIEKLGDIALEDDDDDGDLGMFSKGLGF